MDNRRDEMFPRFTPAQLDRLARLGTERSLATGEVLFAHGATEFPFYVVVEGAIDIVLPDHSLVVSHQVGEFVGDVDMLSGRPAVVAALAPCPTRLLVIPRERLQALVQTDPELSDIILRAFILRRVDLIARGVGDIVLVGSRHSAQTLRLQEFLSRNGRPYHYLDVEIDDSVQALLDRLHVTPDDIPILLYAGERVLKKPSIDEVATVCGMNRLDESTVRDVLVVGAGPSGLAAAVYAASEGLDTLVMEADAPGGQAGTSSKIENYLGFPTGISGMDLAGRALVQAEKFGAHISVARPALQLACVNRPFAIATSSGQAAHARTIVIATGVQYRKPDIPDLDKFGGTGVYFAATAIEARLCRQEDVVIVGGGNSAGQAAVYLSRVARKVHMLVRGRALAETMSRYLIRRIEETPNIELCTRTQIAAIEGDRRIERVVCTTAGETTRTIEAAHVFVMTGADPNTAWLEGCVVLDAKGFVKTGTDLTPEDLKAAGWPLARAPLRFETSRPRVFAVGDVRSGSVKRCSAAVGEGSACAQLLHQVLAE
jgi:thioredoxin reductase (NADPH)